MSSTADLVVDSTASIPAKMDMEEAAKKKTFKTMTTKERLSYMKEIITVEPIIAAYVISSVVCGPALYNLEFEKSCRVDLHLNDTVCDLIINGQEHNYTKENDEIQVLISNMHSWQLPLQSVMPLLLVLFLGSYSDRHKMRKPFLIVPIIGEFFAVAGCILCVVFMKEWPLAVQGVFQTVVPSFFGGQTMLVMAVFAYIADVSTLEMRTLRIGVVQIVLNISVPVAQSVSGILYEKIGYIGVLILAAAFYLFAVLYAFFYIKEPKQPDVVTTKSFLTDAFDPRHALETFNILFKKSPGNNRLFIVITLFILFIYSVVAVGEGSIFYLYVQGQFSWTPVEYSYFITVNTVIHLIGTAIGVPLFTNLLKMGDLMILVISFLDKVFCNLIFGFAKTVTMLYVAAVVSLITGLASIAIRSLATKIVSEDDLGKTQSLFGICEAMGPIVGGPVYNTLIYVNTLDTYPAAYFHFGILLYVICILVILWMYFRTRNARTVQQQANGKDVDVNNKPVEEFQDTHI